MTVQVAGPGGGCGGVGVGHRIPQLARVAFEECPTAITELGVQRACSVPPRLYEDVDEKWPRRKCHRLTRRGSGGRASPLRAQGMVSRVLGDNSFICI